ncbi:MAG: hypothetical protein C0454_01755 [Parvibaculum sp.]|nr:hypothetical protein [Parvibaculum sp.]
MASTASPTFDRTRCVALIVARSQRRAVLSPFFAKSDGLLVVDPTSRIRRFRVNSARTNESICELILASGATRLVCGYVGMSECDKLRAAGIDIRIGSCARTVSDLVSSFETLPPA